MDRGGTITWYLAADDASFLATLRKARAEAKLTGDEIDRSLNKGTAGARDALRKVGSESNTTSGTLRRLKADAVSLAVGTDQMKASMLSVVPSSNTFAQSLGSAAVRSEALRGALGGLTTNSRNMNSVLGSTALKGFAANMSGAGNETEKASRKINNAGLSLRDFRQQIGQSAQTFRSFQIGLRGFELTSLIIGAAIAGGAILELAGAIASLGGLLLTAPAAIATFAGALGALKVATGGIADSFKELTKQTVGVGAATNLAKKQADLMKSANKQDAALTRRLTGLKEDYGDTLKELAEVRMKALNEQILKGVEAWDRITDAASSYLDVSKSIKDLTQDVTDAQNAYNTAMITYGPASQQAIEAQRDLFAAQSKVANANSELDSQYGSIKDNVKDLATNVNSLAKANRNEMNASLLSLKALRLDKQARGESTTEISRMIDLLGGLISVKDTKLTVNPDFAGAENALNGLKSQFPDIAVAAAEATSSAEDSLNKSLRSISDQMADIGRQRVELQAELADSLKEVAESSAASTKDPFEGLSKNARAFVIALRQVADQFKAVRNTVQDNFFAGLDTEIKNVANVTFPILQKGLGDIATAMNGMAKEASRVVQQPFFTGALAASLQNTATATGILTAGVEPLARIFTDLVNIGNPYILMLSNFIVKQLELGAAFTSSAEGQEKITNAINLGIEALKRLADFAGSVGGLLVDLFKLTDGASFLDTLTQIVDKMREYVQSAEGSQRVKALFEATNTIIVALAGVIGTFVDGVLGLVQAYNNLDGPLKSFVTNMLVFAAVATPVITYLSSIGGSLGLVGAFAREAGQALDFVFTGGRIGTAITALGTKIGGLNGVLGLIAKHPVIAILSVLAGIFIYLGTQTTIFQDAFAKLKPVFDELMTALQPVFDVLAEMAVLLADSLAQILPVIAEVFGQVLAALLPLIPPLIQIVIALLPVFVEIVKALILVVKTLTPVVTFIAQVFGAVLVGAVRLVVGALSGFLGIVANIAGFLGNLGATLINAGRQLIEGLVNGISKGKDAVVNKIKEIASGALDTIKKFFGIRSPSRVMAQMGSYVMEGFSNGIEDMGSGVVNAAQTVADGVVDAFSGMSTAVGAMDTNFAVTSASVTGSQFAPAVIDQNSSTAQLSSSGVTINQTNQVYSELDMDQVNRNLTWELNKV